MKETDILKLFINNIPQYVFWKDRNSVYLGCSKNFSKSAGFESSEEIIGKTDYDFPWSTEEADFFREIDRKVMESCKSQLNFEEPQTLVDGSIRWLSTSKIPLFNDNNEVIGILGWYNDISQYKTMEIEIDEKSKALLDYSIQLEKSKSELEIINKDLEMFTYAVSHDLKSPLNNILTISQLIKSDSIEFNTNKLEEINFIIDSAEKMNVLIQDILNFARTGAKDLSAERINIKDLITEKLSLIDSSIMNKFAEVDIQMQDSLINCYPDLMGILFFNLINNGLKFNDAKEPKVVCKISESSSEFLFSVSDNGIGINPKFKDEIFNPFKRLGGKKIEGSGLGLSICKRIVKLHNGKIWVEDNPSGGSNFLFTIAKTFV